MLVRVAGEERLIAAEDAGRYRDALGAMPPGGLPDVFLEGGPRSRWPRSSPLRPLARPVHDRRGERALRPRRRAGAARARARREARPRRAAPGRHRARVVRPGRAAPAAPRVARRAAPRGRAGRAGGARPLPAELARDRPARVAARGARAAAGARAAGRALGDRGAAAARARLPPGAARPALRDRRGRLGRRRGSTASRSSSARTPPCSGRPAAPPPPRARRTTASARRSPRARSSGSTCSRRRGSRPEDALPALWDLVWAGEVTNDAWHAAAGRTAVRDPEAGAALAPLLAHPRDRGHGDAGPLVAHGRPALRGATPDRRALAELLLERQGIVTATASAARASRAATARSTAS